MMKFYEKDNIFVPDAPFLYPLKTSENRPVFWWFQGVEKGYIGNKSVKTIDVWKGPKWVSGFAHS